MHEVRESICIISFTPVTNDARVLRQIQYLSPHYDLTVISPTPDPPAEVSGINWIRVLPVKPDRSLRRFAQKFVGLCLLLGGRLRPSNFEHWFWRQPIMKDTLAKAVASGAEAFHANDWNTLPVAAEAAQRLGARFVFDDHEYAPLEFHNSRKWRLTYEPLIRHLVSKYGARADAIVTVAPAIAERYRRELGFSPIVIMNAPSKVELPVRRDLDFGRVRLIHHGAAIAMRRLEVMIEAIAASHSRFSLHFMLTGSDPHYLAFLRKKADEIAPGRVTFHDPVPTEQVIARIAEFDIGFCYIAPVVFSYLVSLPNKFFDFIGAGLPVFIGPSPSMAEIVRTYDLGWVAPSFEAHDLAAALNSLTEDRLAAMREGVRRAAQEVNAEREMGRLVELYKRLLSPPAA